jgi:hypothetical protein
LHGIPRLDVTTSRIHHRENSRTFPGNHPALFMGNIPHFIMSLYPRPYLSVLAALLSIPDKYQILEGIWLNYNSSDSITTVFLLW